MISISSVVPGVVPGVAPGVVSLVCAARTSDGDDVSAEWHRKGPHTEARSFRGELIRKVVCDLVSELFSQLFCEQIFDGNLEAADRLLEYRICCVCAAAAIRAFATTQHTLMVASISTEAVQGQGGSANWLRVKTVDMLERVCVRCRCFEK